ncbi:similar to Saccharomyces cerevisiae YDR306C F-box protein of unknown function [Maudiozyma barnettii]|uniref:F-box domain-containing protein n=1 Tax=Maudiozyma barnettii TaxID=61262 RepID=A0A8H2VGT5_9SACH|nr:Pfu1p [Kazachstania barnettii]CAB4254968.1 similar to Saccharomyces cerevisiae YDR306C F-box protein of unknown function [Kazachstania barnettii]CAD1783239.1 similar to Saccharomyces cerevisiae YDR306C F-box protein of unknown function [Kazachstania barnettii]
MANKSRPKQARAPYRKYVAGEGFSKVMLSRKSYKDQKKANNSYGTSKDLDDDGEEENEIKYHIIKDASGKTYYMYDTSNSNDHLEKTPEIPADIICKEEYGDKGDTLIIRQKPIMKMKLPWEIQNLILKYTEEIDIDYLVVCKVWYVMCLPLLYAKPELNSKNFNKFITSIIVDRKKVFGQYIKELDLSTILQSGRNSYVSKLLRRCSSSLERFTAPQTSFGYAPLISLKSCHQLRYLDLGLVSETVKLKDLFAAIKNFKYLTHLAFPRSSVDCEGFREFVWPQNLLYLKLSGGITNEFVIDTMWPHTIKILEYSFCPKINENAIYTMLSQIGDNLTHLYFHYPMPALRDNSLDFIFRYCTHLVTVQLMVDYTSKWAFSDEMLIPIFDFKRPLRTIFLESSGTLGMASKIHPDDFTIALLEHRLPSLKYIRLSPRLGWDIKSEDVSDLVNALEEQDGSLYVGNP